jgi:glycosyltransferase involved in cell wall biosynthesis
MKGVRNTVSVIMPCYNSAAFIEQAVRSVLNQSYRGLELIVVNDGSTDASLDILQRISDPRLKVIDQPNRGVVAARNHGLKEATGEYIAFLDADDKWREDFIEKMLAALQARLDAGLAYCGWQNVGLPGGRANPFVPPDYENEEKVEKLLWECRWPIHAVLVKRKLIDAAGGFDEAYSSAEDYWLWLRIAPQNPVIRVPEVMSYYHHHGNQRSTEKNLLQKGLDRWHIRRAFVAQYPECVAHLTPTQIRDLTHGRLLDWGFKCYWQRELAAAHPIFRQLMREGYGSPRDWRYMLPALLPLRWYERLVLLVDRAKGRK